MRNHPATSEKEKAVQREDFNKPVTKSGGKKKSGFKLLIQFTENWSVHARAEI